MSTLRMAIPILALILGTVGSRPGEPERGPSEEEAKFQKELADHQRKLTDILATGYDSAPKSQGGELEKPSFPTNLVTAAGTGSVLLTVRDGIPPFTWKAENRALGKFANKMGAFISQERTVDYFPLAGAAGYNPVTVADARGWEAKLTVVQGDRFIPRISMVHARTFADTGFVDGHLSVSVEGGVPPYRWAIPPDLPPVFSSGDASRLTLDVSRHTRWVEIRVMDHNRVSASVILNPVLKK